MSWIAQKCILAYGWHRAMIMVLAGALAGLSMPPLFFLLGLYLALPLWVWCLDGAEKETGLKRLFGPAFHIGFSFGFGYFLVSLHWIGFAFLVEGGLGLAAMPFALIALSALLALYWGLASALAHLLWTDSWVRVVTLSVFVAGAEFMRATLFTGFPFDLLGYALTANETMMQAASLIGVFGLTFVAAFSGFVLALIWPADERALTTRLIPLFIVLSLLALQLGYGQNRLTGSDITMRTDMRLRLVQPGIAQAQKWLPGNELAILDRLIALSSSQTGPDNTGLLGITHVIWPEAALPFFLQDYPVSLVRIAQMLPPRTTLILGVPNTETSSLTSRSEYNSILALNSEGETVARYDKTHLVPIGEYLPFQSFFSRFGLQQFVTGSRGWSAGENRLLMQTPATPPFLPLICYEAIFSGDIFTARDGMDMEQAQFILNLTNDAWFDNSIGPAQHFHHARLRAVEHGIPMVRVANTGRSAIIDPLGRLTGVMEAGETGLIDADMPNRLERTFFSTYQNLPFFAVLLVGFLFSLGTHFLRKKS